MAKFLWPAILAFLLHSSLPLASQPLRLRHDADTIKSGCASSPVTNGVLSVKLLCGTKALWQVRGGDGTFRGIAAPKVTLDGRQIELMPSSLQPETVTDAGAGITEYVFSGPVRNQAELRLQVVFRLARGSHIIRFQYQLSTISGAFRFSGEQPEYLRVKLPAGARLREVQLGQFAGMFHSYTLETNELRPADLQPGRGVSGPVFTASDGQQTLILAYEHGSTVPESFLEFAPIDRFNVALRGVKGNVLSGEMIDSAHPWKSPWLEAGITGPSPDDAAHAYRSFILSGMTVRNETRRPYIFYNTWNYQERQRSAAGKNYLDSINLDRALREIDIAHRMGIDVYVLDTGWYKATGDWQVSPERFPDGLQQVKRRLAEYGMRLGLWFGPASASVSSAFVREHPEWRASWNGVVAPPYAVWETEPSYSMCLVSGYSEAFAGKVIAVAKATGATYFKFDGVGQHSCNDPHHDHGTEANTPQDRDNSYAFQVVDRLTRIAEKIDAAIPGAIVDLDMTEKGRPMGLEFLTAGKYFLVNNGPYYQDYGIPINSEKDNWNLFFYPGQGRTWIVRAPLGLDAWVPSTLFLAHYFPDGPEDSQILNMASMILGQDGIWGDLLALTPPEIATVAAISSRYKLVREDMAASDPIVTGTLSGSPETHEKIAANGRGAVVVFATSGGTYQYVTRNRVSAKHWATAGTQIENAPDGTVRLTCVFDHRGAKIIFFGTDK
jgi:alpha-galactosidase